MTWLATCVIALCASIPHSLQDGQGARLMVRLMERDGRSGVATEVQTAPYEPTRPLSVLYRNPTATAKTADGLVVSALSVYAWHEGDTISAVVLAAVPTEGSENRLYPFSASLYRTLKFQEFARYKISPDAKPVVVAEMTSLGVEPMTLEVARR
jgi:hypothetical protein